MEAWLANLKQNPSMFYFLVIFAVLWGGGVLWGVAVVIQNLGKGRRAAKVLRAAGFVSAKKNTSLMMRSGDVCTKTLFRDFATKVDPNPRDAFVNRAVTAKEIAISYEIPESEYRDLSRAGLKEAIQLVKREIRLSRILFREWDGKEGVYAQTTDTEVIRAFKPRRRIQSSTGWALCVRDQRDGRPEIGIYRKFTGARGLLMKVASGMAHASPLPVEGLLAEFECDFQPIYAEKRGTHTCLDERLQRMIASGRGFLPEGVKLFLSREGVWVTGEELPGGHQIGEILALCGRLTEVG